MPILLFVTALMLNFGTMAAWRVRGEVVSRDAVWRVRTPRTGSTEPRPETRVWPKEATMSLVQDAPVSNIDLPQIQHPVVRGPLPNGFEVRPILDPDFQDVDEPSALVGKSSIVRTYPMLAKLGEYKSGDIRNSLLDKRWQVWEMHIRSNRSRRVPYIYALPQTDPSLPKAFVQAWKALLAMANFDDLDVLERDDEIRYWTGSDWDFHPPHRSIDVWNSHYYLRSIRQFARTDVEEVRELIRSHPRISLVDHQPNLNRVRLGNISLLPRKMTHKFLTVFNEAVDSLRQQIQGLQQQLDSSPPPSAQQQQAILAQIQSLQAQIDILLPKIEQLEEYRAQLPAIEAKLEEKYLDYVNSGT